MDMSFRGVASSHDSILVGGSSSAARDWSFSVGVIGFAGRYATTTFQTTTPSA